MTINMRRLLKLLEHASLVTGSALVMLAGFVWIDGHAYSQTAIEEFERIRNVVAGPDEQVDWSPTRKEKYQASLMKDAGVTLAVLRIPSIGIEVPVFDSTSDLALNRGAGHVSSTAVPGEGGNVAIAAHRDGFFRALKDIEVGDEIELTTLDEQQSYTVTKLSIVDPLEVSVLDPTEEPAITLITCYPFYFMGAAPERFIVRATLN